MAIDICQKYMPDVMALQQHASKLLYCVSKFSQKCSVTWDILITVQKHLFMLILEPISNSMYIDKSIFTS